MLTSEDIFVGISSPYHFKFFMKDNKHHVKTKDYSCDIVRNLVSNYKCLRALPSQGLKSELATVDNTKKHEIKDLESFIELKEQSIAKSIHMEQKFTNYYGDKEVFGIPY